jgi:hypothetical protein
MFPESLEVRRVFELIREGDLEQLKIALKGMPSSYVQNMKQ